MSDGAILYMGDTSLATAASYLAGVMTHAGLEFDYLASDQALTVETASRARKLFIFSDYPSKQVSKPVTDEVLEQVRHGAGLMMIGGWESFHGFGGDWDGTAIGQALPVEIAGRDDRVNCDQPAMVVRKVEHEAVDGLPWDDRPPTIGGFNAFAAKAEGTTVLEVIRTTVHREEGRFCITELPATPLLVTGTFGRGRTAALATDLAPHWVGGLVDWGTGPRVKATGSRSVEIEVGDLYARFIKGLLKWTGRL